MKFFNNKGIAYLIVISFVTLMMSIVVSLKERTLLNHDIALNAEARLQSYYMARSALNFSRLLLLYNKKIESQIKQSGVSDSTASKMGFQPLYRMFPLSSELLRGVAQMAGSSAEEGGAAETETAGEDMATAGSENTQDSFGKDVGLLQKEKFEEFLDFDGDFSVEVQEESARYSLSAISKMTPTSTSYDLHKKILLGILMRPKFRNFFDNQDREAPELAHALADFVDANDAVNEFNQVERGREAAGYKGTDIKPKNTKFLTLSELRLVPGMTDDIYANLEPYVTVYQSTDKMNVCLGDEDLLDALIVHYTTESGCVNPIDPDKDDLLKDLREEVLANCTDVNAMANALNVKLGIKSERDVAAVETSGTAESQQTSAQVSGCKVQFKDLITASNDIFTLLATGQVGEVRTVIRLLLDTTSSNATAWKTLYYQVQ